MITLIFNEDKKQPLYEQLYVHIKELIEEGTLKVGEKLPSKRKLSSHLHISQITVQNSYTQLILEGYITSIEKKGYYVQHVEHITKPLEDDKNNELSINTSKDEIQSTAYKYHPNNIKYDLETNMVDTKNFPFSTWARLMRECLQGDSSSLLKQVHPQGDLGLRNEIAKYLHDFRNMDISAEQIVLGAGSEYLFGLIIEMLPNSIFATENPGYYKTSRILQSRGIPIHAISMDKEGLRVEELRNTTSTVAHVTPSHHFPLGTIMSINCRRKLLHWASQSNERYIIEDDYDSEYRFVLRPIPTLQSLDSNDKVIYINTFAKTLAPSLRIGYMVLPKKLLLYYRENLMFYSCTVSEFEQLTLKAFIKGGYYERHLSRMKNIYKNRRDAFLEGLLPLDDIVLVSGQDAGTHLLLQVNNGMTESELIESARSKGVGVYPLSSYYHENELEKYNGKYSESKTVVVGYASLDCTELKDVASLLAEAWR